MKISGLIRRISVGVALGTIVCAGVAGCSSSDIEALQTEQAEGDQIPSYVEDENIDMATTRYLGTRDDVDVYVGQDTTGAQTCLILTTELTEEMEEEGRTNWITSCSRNGAKFETSLISVQAKVDTTERSCEDWEILTSGVCVR